MRSLRWLLTGLLIASSGAALTACGDESEGPANVDPIDDENNGENNDELPATNNDQFPTEEEVDVSEAFLRDSCETYCAQLTLCGQGDNECIASCLEDTTADIEVLAEVHCVSNSECGDLRNCRDGDLANDRDCAELCERVGDCDGYPSDFFGPDEAACTQSCSGFVAARPDTRALELTCYYGLLRNNCQLDNVGECQLDLGDDDLCSQMCGNLIENCNGIPGPVFVTAGECLESCRDKDLQSQIIMNTCADSAGCDLYERCFPPTEVISEDCSPFCTSLGGKCPGAVPDEVCPAFCAGFLQALPGADLIGGSECIDAADECPGEGIFLCLLPEYEGCDDICGALEACGAEVQECAQGCSYLAALNPETMDDLRECSLNSGCNAIGQCFQ